MNKSDASEGGEVKESAFKALICEAIALNIAGKVKTSKRAKPLGISIMNVRERNSGVEVVFKEFCSKNLTSFSS